VHRHGEENLVQIWSPDHSESGSRRLPKFNGDLLVQRHISGKIFMKI